MQKPQSHYEWPRRLILLALLITFVAVVLTLSILVAYDKPPAEILAKVILPGIFTLLIITIRYYFPPHSR